MPKTEPTPVATTAAPLLPGTRRALKNQARPRLETPPDPELWTRSLTLALAQQSCSHCYGLGLRAGRAGKTLPCNCVYRAVFRACYARFRQCASKEAYISRVSLEANPGAENRSKSWGMKNEEFIADFCLVARRALSDAQHKIFKFHYLLGGDWTICAPKLGLDRGAFFHDVYRIEQRLGRVFAELSPYALFPCDEYFSAGCARLGTDRREDARRRFDSLFGKALAQHA